MIWNQDMYTAAWRFACECHLGQTVPGTDIPYINHISNVAMEIMACVAAGCEDFKGFDADFAVTCALLHDCIEDSQVTVQELEERFGGPVARGVSALSKDAAIADKSERMRDSLRRIREQPREVWMVKLADRIVNLQPPPAHWGAAKVEAYLQEAGLIHAELAQVSPFLADRLAKKMKRYLALTQEIS